MFEEVTTYNLTYFGLQKGNVLMNGVIGGVGENKYFLDFWRWLVVGFLLVVNGQWWSVL